MVNKKIYEIKWHSKFCEKDLVIRFSNLHEFVGALRAIVKDDPLDLIDVTTFEPNEH